MSSPPPCGRGCSIGANFQSTTVLIPPALATKNLTVVTNALVYQVDLDAAGKAKGVTYVDRRTGEHRSAVARAVVLAAGSGETARILLNSKSAKFPDGLCNTHGMVGRYLMDSVGLNVTGQFPALEGLPPTNDDGMSVSHAYVPWWGYDKHAELGFPRGYHVEIGGGRQMPSMSLGRVLPEDEVSVGEDLRATLRRRYGSVISFNGRGEMIPNDDCYCELDPTVKDRWGIPVLRFHWKWGEAETKQAAHMVTTFLEVIDRLGGKPLGAIERDGRKAISKGGEMIHEVGTVRMGASEADSVVNQYGQAWAVPNLFVTDGAVLVSSPDKNPTLSILALAWRSSDNLVNLAKRGNCERRARPPEQPYVRKIDRRTALIWVGAVGAAAAAGAAGVVIYREAIAPEPEPPGYGTDPKLNPPLKAAWRRLLTDDELQAAAVLSDYILPASGAAPAASTLGVPDFIDEWVSAPYPDQIEDRPVIRDGLKALIPDLVRGDAAKRAAALAALPTARDAATQAFFRRFRALTIGAYYTTEAGFKDIGYIGNEARASDPGPSAEVKAVVEERLRALGL
ncbi:GMC oxidoreductase [Phenylobacterium sp. J367]|uniref:GMC oxidoreductase n=1 Tax=Phenylobacterium sp. J367 TaxID=2898435 RepID=UPI0021510F02|nr:GMC oxidoreductase [Phenylobacterium sp. J367]MCR5878637.1 GMC oxidoreductase [Phenylobacterium sp. J367]